VAALARTETYPSDKRGAYLGGTDLVTALRIYGSVIELPLLVGQQVTTLGRKGDLRVDHRYLAAVHVRFERAGGYLRAENVSTDKKNPIIFEHREVAECFLQPGDQFRIGDTTYYALNDEMRLARRWVAEILGETNDAAIDDCLITAAVDPDRPVVLLGPPGGDQQRMGQAIHWASTRRRHPFREVPPTNERGGADLQSIRDARDGTLLIWLPVKGRFDPVFVEHAVAPGARARLIICTHAPGKVAKSFPASVAENAKRITIAPLTARKHEIPVLLDRWFIEHRSSLRFGALAPKVQDKLLSYRWRKNLQELRGAAEHLALLAYYKSEREAERDTTVTRSESRAWRERLKLPLPLVPDDVVESTDQPPLLTHDEETGLTAALASLQAEKGRTLEQIHSDARPRKKAKRP
jgi:hypothetical protein